MKKTKLVPITSLDQLEVGSVVVYCNKEKYKVLAKCGLIVWIDQWDSPLQLKSFSPDIFQLEVTEEPWVPEQGQLFYMSIIKEYGDKSYRKGTWAGDSLDRQILAEGLVCKTKEEALAKAQKMLDSIKDLE